MFRRRFQLPLSNLNRTSPFSSSIKTTRRRNLFRWCKLLLSGLVPLIIGVFTVVFSIQQHSLSTRQRQQEQQNQIDAQHQSLFVSYIDEISHHLLSPFEHNKTDPRLLLHIRTKTLTALRNLDATRKKYIILFLYESRLLQYGGLDLSGADLNNIQFVGPYELDYLYLPDVFWSNAVFINCRLRHAMFNRSNMNNARFVNSTLESAVLADATIDNSVFTQTTLIRANFSGASLVKANFFDAQLVQKIDFANADLLDAGFTDRQLRGQVTTVLSHNFSHARFPNGSFGPIDTKQNLVQNGDIETQCSSNGYKPWAHIFYEDRIFVTNLKTIVNDGRNWGNCTFGMRAGSRIYQVIHLNIYSLLIKTGNAVFLPSAFVGCNLTGENAYVEIITFRWDDSSIGSRLYLSGSKQTTNGSVRMHVFTHNPHHLNTEVRSIRIYLGVIDSLPLNTVCYFDNVTITMTQFNKSIV